MKFGLDNRQWQMVSDLALAKLKAAGAKVWIFGSRSRGDHQEFSDLDVLFEGQGPVPRALISEIREQLEESRLPIKVDLVEWSELADDYRPGVVKDRVQV